MNTTIEFNYQFPLPNGLHARPASAIEEMVKTLDGEITITNRRSNKEADASSVLSLIGSDIALNDDCLIRVIGVHGEAVAEEFKQFLNSDFLTCDEALPELDNPSELPLPYILKHETMDAQKGIAVSPGIARGKPVILGEPKLVLDVNAIDVDSVDTETRRFAQAQQQLKKHLEQNLAHATAQEQEITKAHLALLADKSLTGGITTALSQGKSVLAAILSVQAHFTAVIESSSSSYLRERVLDIRDLCSQLTIEVYGEDSYETTDNTLHYDAICIANNLAPSQFLELDRQRLKGLVLESGGTTSHTVILARSFGIPVLVGVDNASSRICADHDLILDANHGILISDPSENIRRYYDMEQNKLDRMAERRQQYLDKKGQTSDGHTIEVAANIASAEEAESAFANGAEAIGLFRTEMLYMDRTQPPCEEEQFGIYKKALTAGNGKPVIIRTMDIGGDKPVDYFNIGAEENPFLGYRAVRIYPEYMDYFRPQMRAILRASIYGQCKIMVPMVATLEEARWLRETFNDIKASMQAEGISFAEDLPLGIMLEVPSCAFIIDQLVKYVDFFSIGSNDLTQYFMAADRGNDNVKKVYDSLNPAFLRKLKFIVEEVHKAGSWVGMCGEFAGDPLHMPLMAGLGLDEISLGATRIPEVKETLSQLTLEHSRELLEQAMRLETGKEVRTLLQQGAAAVTEELPILDQACVTVDAECRNKAEVIKTLIDNLAVNGRVSDIVGAETAIWDREAISPTMLGFGIAIPHCKSDSIAANTISIMKLKDPVIWNEGDTVKTDTVFMLTVRASEAGSTHMKIFAQLARRIMREAFRENLAACKDQQTLSQYISEELEL